MKVSFEGIGEQVATFYSYGAAVGPVKIVANNRVTACSAGDRFAGVCLSCESGKESASVQLEGVVTLACTGTLPGLGFARLVGDGSGGVQLGEAGSEYRILTSRNGQVTFIL